MFHVVLMPVSSLNSHSASSGVKMPFRSCLPVSCGGCFLQQANCRGRLWPTHQAYESVRVPFFGVCQADAELLSLLWGCRAPSYTPLRSLRGQGGRVNTLFRIAIWCCTT